MTLQGKVALVTGAAGGLGLGIAERFAQEGAFVVLADRDTARGESAAARLRAEGLSAQFIPVDLAKPDDITRLIRLTLEQARQLDILVNNAATFLPKAIEEITVAEWDLLMAVNLRAPFLLVQAALPALKAARGIVLNIGSTAGLRVFSPNLPYSAAKAGLMTMTQSLAQELRPHGIRVNCLCPGAVDTPGLRTDLLTRTGDVSALDELRASGMLTTPRQLADVALLLVSEAGAAINGSIIVADAGALLM